MSASPSIQPTPVKDRLFSLDFVRGIAVCGILVINMRYFAMPMSELGNAAFPSGELSNGNFLAWFFSSLFFEDKMIAVFSMLFGAGIFMMATKGALRHYSRMFWLFAIGAFHAYVLWFGDILMLYAMCGCLVVWLRRLPAGLLVALGVASVLAAISWRGGSELYGDVFPLPAEVNAEVASTPPDALPETPPPAEPSAQRLAFRKAFNPETELAAHQGSYIDLFTWRADLNLAWHFLGFFKTAFWQYGGFMLIGMGLMAMGFLSGRKKANTYLAIGVSAFLLGAVLTGLGMHLGSSLAWNPDHEFERAGIRRIGMISGMLRHIGAGVMSIGWLSLAILLSKTPLLSLLLKPFAAMGRMALSNYLTHTVICVLFYEGWAWSNFGKLDYLQQFELMGIILAVQFVLCPIWLRIFRFGPAEWIWRSLTYWERQPFFARVAAAAPVPAAPAPLPYPELLDAPNSTLESNDELLK